MGRPKGSKNGEHVHRHGSTTCYYRCKCRCDECVARHAEHVVWFREYQRGRSYHGLTPKQREVLKADGCRVCGSSFLAAIDHDHQHCAGRFGCEECVRGVLCSPCNRILGYAEDNPARLRALADYLENNFTTPGFLADVTEVWAS